MSKKFKIRYRWSALTQEIQILVKNKVTDQLLSTKTIGPPESIKLLKEMVENGVKQLKEGEEE